MSRVAITGVGLASPIGHDLDTVSVARRCEDTGIVVAEEWDRIGELHTRLAGKVRDLPLSKRWPRKAVRTMGRVALLAAHASESAVAQSTLTSDVLASGRVGLAFGSTHGSSSELEAYCRDVFDGDTLRKVTSSQYIKFMSHTCAANLAVLHGIRGRVVSTCAACVSASQAIGQGFEIVRSGIQDVMICGGAEELHWVPAGVFDVFHATSTRYNDAPDRSPRPFDAERDGLVVAEGAGAVILEREQHARARGAPILGYVEGYGTSCDGAHATAPLPGGMAAAMRLALESASVSPDAIDYVNAHATGTEIGDVAEAEATAEVFGRPVPISSTKGHTGHTLGACGAIEVAFCLAMIRDGFLAPTRNLDTLDPACAALDYVREPRTAAPTLAMTNNFAFGGINTSLILRGP